MLSNGYFIIPGWVKQNVNLSHISHPKDVQVVQTFAVTYCNKNLSKWACINGFCVFVVFVFLVLQPYTQNLTTIHPKLYNTLPPYTINPEAQNDICFAHTIGHLKALTAFLSMLCTLYVNEQFTTVYF